eukprot:gene5543-biopygen4825
MRAVFLAFATVLEARVHLQTGAATVPEHGLRCAAVRRAVEPTRTRGAGPGWAPQVPLPGSWCKHAAVLTAVARLLPDRTEATVPLIDVLCTPPRPR